jgi:phosphohistidine swiveling domain-containing protein
MAMKKVRVEGTVPKHDYDGIAAGGGLVVGHVVTTSAQAKNEGKDKPVILVTDETTPEDFGGMAASVGILTRTGGKTCHAAVVGRSLEKHCVVGCTDLLDLTGFPGQITIDGSSGRVWLTGLPLSKGKIDKYAGLILEWAIDDNSDIVIKTTHEDELLNGRYITTDGTDAVQFAAFLQKANADNSITECYIDLTLAGENQLAVDKDLWNLVGDCAPVDQQTILQDRMAALLSTPKAFPLKGIAVLVPSVYSDIHEINQLRKSGWKVVSRIKTIAELLSSDGIVDIDEGFAKDIGGESVANKLFKIMEDAGKPVRRKPKAVSQNRLVFDVLK